MRVHLPAYRLLAGAALLFAACAGPSRSYRAGLNAKIAAHDYAGARADIEQNKTSEYGEKNSVLYYLDLGMVQHDSASYRESELSLATAENRMEELFTRSVSRRAGTLLLNDNTTKYAGEVFERALLNAFRALNYVFLGKTDDALVEARKVTAYLGRFNEFMQGKSGYQDSAFSQYLSAMLFEQNGDHDDARIAYKAAAAAYKTYAADYGMPEPEFTSPPYSRLESLGVGELIFFHYNGPAPMKISRTFQVAWNEAMLAVSQSGEEEAGSERFANAVNAGLIGSAITVAYPQYVQDPYTIAGSRIEAAGARSESLLVEDISAIARQVLESKNAAIRLRAIARATIKFVLARAASAEVENRAGAGLGFLAKMVTSAAGAATETADTRGWTTLPAQIRMARVTAAPGRQDVKITFTDRNGAPSGTIDFKDVEVVKGRRTYLHYRTAH
ncbi:MAG: hypothetical protein A2285_07190 [Elusimicrobia bacterium RIFOXYA12_FULL_57_11]|nr:MAG: hypothetical protein A2285_07190 [Elusimicrobia bacterium RIFOXYA12_FULL_57_11]